MAKYPLLLIFAVLGFSVFSQYTPSQPFEKIVIENVKPIYHETLHDPSFRENGSDGYNCFSDLEIVEPLVYNNYLFTIHNNYLASPGSFGQYYITCINMDNGKVQWMEKLITDNVTNIEIPRLMKVNEKNQLVITGCKKKSIYTGQGFISDGLLFHRIYNIDDGTLISINHRPFDDTLAYNFEFEYFNPSLFYEVPNKGYRIIEKFEVGNKVGLKSVLLDYTGAILNKPDTLFYTYFTDFVNGANVAKIGSDSLVLIEISLNQTNALIIFRYLTDDLKLINEIQVISPVEDNLPYIRLNEVSPDKDKILLSIYQYDENKKEEYSLRLVIDRLGEIIKQSKMSLITKAYNWYSDIDDFWGYYTSNDVIYNETDKNKLKFISCNDDSGCDVVKQLTFSDKFRFAYISKYFQYQDKEITILIEGALKKVSSGYTYDDVAFATSIVAFKKGELLPEIFTISLNDEEMVKGPIKTYPNPFSDFVTIKFNGNQSNGQICLYNLFGRKVFVQNVKFDGGEISLNLSDLEKGVYIYQIYQNNIALGTGKMIKL